jgi:hypothetical protein
MNTIYLKIDKTQKEDDLLDLVRMLQGLFGMEHVKVMAIETDLPSVMAMLKAIPEREGSVGGSNGNGKKLRCVDCGASVSKEGGRCKSCSRREMLRKKAEQGESTIETEEEVMA